MQGKISGKIVAEDFQGSFHRFFQDLKYSSDAELRPFLPSQGSLGQRVALMAEPKAAFVQALFQAWEQRALPIILNPSAYSDTAFKAFAQKHQICACWRSDGGWTSLPQTALAAPETPPHADAALVLMTSGSSGEAKGVVLTQAGILANIAAVKRDMNLAEPARVGVILPLFHSFALITQLLLTLRTGGELHLLPSHHFPAERLDYLQEHRIQRLAGVPTHFRFLFQDAQLKLPELRHLQVAGAALDQATAQQILRVCPQAQLWVGYGLSEAGPRVSAISQADPHFVRGSVGRPLSGVRVRIQRDEIQIQSPACFAGYLDRRDLSAAQWDGDWLRTGDRGSLHDACLYVHGRLDSLILSAGEKIAPQEIEAVLLACPGVEEAAVYGEADPILGEKLVACLRGSVAQRVLRQHLRAHLPSEKRPRSWYAVDTLPRTANGKLRRKELPTWPKHPYPPS